MQEKTDFFFHYKICNFPSFLEILIDIWLIYLHIVKINDLEIIFMLQGFLIFALHCMRNTQVRKNIELIINFISSSFSVSINIRVLRTIFRVARLSADQRAIQKKDEHRFSILYKKTTPQGKAHVSIQVRLGMDGQSNCSIVLNLDRNRT